MPNSTVPAADKGLPNSAPPSVLVDGASRFRAATDSTSPRPPHLLLMDAEDILCGALDFVRAIRLAANGLECAGDIDGGPLMALAGVAEAMGLAADGVDCAALLALANIVVDKIGNAIEDLEAVTSAMPLELA
jgi:hypothetical protein